MAAPPSVENSVAVTGLRPLEKTVFIFLSVVLSNSLIKAISSNFAEPTLLELALTKEVAAAAISCGLERRKFIPFEGLVGTILNSSPLSAFPKKESLKPLFKKSQPR